MEIDKDLFCRDLRTTPNPEMGKILVTGASGYIGGTLIRELSARGYKVRAMVRSNPDTYEKQWPGVEVVRADALDIESLRTAFDGIEAAYYLIHSLYLGPKSFESTDIKAADNFTKAASEKGVKRIIYLGGLGDIRSHLSHHLTNRIDVAIRLIMGDVPVTTVRAAVIIGSGSASYEIIHHLVKKLPVLLIPPWAKSKCQPISVRDVVKYLVGVLEVPETAGKYFDIGGRDILTYEEMMRTFARAINKRILFIPVPFNNIAFYSYFASLIAPLPYTLIRCLIESLQNEVVSQDDSIRIFIPLDLLSYKESVIKAVTHK